MKKKSKLTKKVTFKITLSAQNYNLLKKQLNSSEHLKLNKFIYILIIFSTLAS